MPFAGLNKRCLGNKTIHGTAIMTQYNMIVVMELLGMFSVLTTHIETWDSKDVFVITFLKKDFKKLERIYSKM